MKLAIGQVILLWVMLGGVGHVAGAEHAQRTQEPIFLEEVVVTAQKRAENAQDVPIALNAYSGERLSDSGIENTIDLQVIEPSLVFTTNAAFGQPYLRGVGSDLFTPGAESSIGVFVDDVYQSRTVSALQDFFDVERVDVVKGPQGVLFGRNAVGGAINIYSAKPTNELEGRLAIGVGNFSKIRTEGFINIPIADNRAAWRLAGLASKRDGYTDNVVGGDVDDQDMVGFRTHLRVNAADNLELLFSASYTSEDSSRSLAARVDTRKGLAIADFFGAQRPDGAFNIALNEDSFVDLETKSFSLTANWDIGMVLFRSITAYRETDLAILLDLDASQLDFASNAPVQESETVSQEFQLVSQGDGPFEWTVGAFFLDEEASQRLDVKLDFPAVTGAPSDFRDEPGGAVDTESFGVFGNVRYRLSEKWAISAGMRYNKDDRDLDFLETLSVASIGAIIAQIPLQLSDSYDAYTPRVILEHTPQDNLLFYASASRGYKAGGFNTNTFQTQGFDPEFLWAYELGVKAEILDRRARINSALFYYDYSDLQLNTIPPGSPVGTFQIVINAAEATIRGWDLDSAWAVSENLTVNIGFQLLDAEFDDFIALNPNNLDAGEADRSGDRLPRAPETSFNVGAEYRWRLGENPLRARMDVRYESEQFLDIFSDDAVQRDSNVVVNAQISYDFGDRVTVSAWGRNLTDEEIVQSSLRVDGLFGTIQFFAPPRAYGATLDFRF